MFLPCLSKFFVSKILIFKKYIYIYLFVRLLLSNLWGKDINLIVHVIEYMIILQINIDFEFNTLPNKKIAE